MGSEAWRHQVLSGACGKVVRVHGRHDAEGHNSGLMRELAAGFLFATS